MEDIILQNSLGNAQVDAVVKEVIRVYEDTFPGQIAAYYLEGSYADQTQLTTSDIDVVIVFLQPLTPPQTRQAVEHVWAQHKTANTLEVDITIEDERELSAGVSPMLKLSSQLLYGEDICHNYPIIPMEDWTRDRMHASYWLMVNVYQRPKLVQLTLEYPNPIDEFYGYINRTIQLPDGREIPCTRNLVRTTGWAATALLALQAGQYAGRKRDCAYLYRSHIGGEWASLLDEIEARCRHEWRYLIPDEPVARQHLRAICARTLLFERHFLKLYRDYVLKQFSSTERAQLHHAIWVQEQWPLADEDVGIALQIVR